MSAPSHVIAVDRLPPGGKQVRLEADETARAEIATALGISSVEALTAELDVRRLGAGTVGVRGRLAATVVQTDVVTLEPVRQDVAEEVDVTLVPDEDRRGEAEHEQPAGTEEYDRYRNGRIDLWSIAIEHLALGLDPYPREAGVEFSGHVEDDSPAGASAFAALEKLKRDQK